MEPARFLISPIYIVVKRIRNQLILLVVAGLGALLLVQYLRILKPAQARAVRAACIGMRPSATNPVLGPMDPLVPATDFKLEDSSGNQVSLSDYRGKIVIVNFWASWCSVCRSEKPSLENFQDDNGGDDVVVLALASDDNWGEVRRALLGFEVKRLDEMLARPEIYGLVESAYREQNRGQVLVSRVDGNRAAAKGGLSRIDRLVSLNGAPINSIDDLDSAMRGPLESMTLKVNRNGVLKDLVIENKEKLRVLIDPPDDEGNLGAIAKSYGITAVPESFVVDRDGKIRHYFINRRNWGGDVAATCMQDLIDG